MGLHDYLFHEEPGITLYCGDCREILGAINDRALDPIADLVLTDPPYNVGTRYGVHDDRMPADKYITWLAEVLAQTAGVTRDGLVYFPGCVNAFGVAEVLGKTPYRPLRMLGWHRKAFAGDRITAGPIMSWEPVVWASQSPEPFFNRVWGQIGRDLLVVPSTQNDPLRAFHPCPKPLKVMAWLVGLFAPPSGTVLDCFAGVGTTLLAAKELGRRAIGIEMEAKYCEIAVKRLRQEVLPL